MNEPEAKFILRSYRSDGSDAIDPKFAEALAHARSDPRLSAWLERERAFDAAISARLATLQPPAELRAAILAGARASQPRPRWWARPIWLAAAASIALLLSLTVRLRSSNPPAPTAQALAAFALDDLAHHHDQHEGHPSALLGLQAQFANATTPLPGHLDLDFNDLKQKNCRTAHFAGRDVFEICFEREGHWYHLYAARVEDFAPGAADPRALVVTQGKLAATAWKDSKHIYALVAGAGPEVLKHLL